MTPHRKIQLTTVLLVALTGCSATAETTNPNPSRPLTSSAPSPTSSIQDVMGSSPRIGSVPGPTSSTPTSIPRPRCA